LIQVDIKSERGIVTEVFVRGHGEGIKGKDILCSAVSAVTQTALSGLLYFGKEDLTWRRGKGTLYMKVNGDATKENQRIFNTILSTMVLGLINIAKEYPARIKIWFDGELKTSI
jgi:uncharacterized protein YsxB (DUF464 family)